MWEARVFRQLDQKCYTERASVACRNICNALNIPYLEGSAEVRTDLYLVTDDPNEGLKLRNSIALSKLTDRKLELKRVIERTSEGAECITKESVPGAYLDLKKRYIQVPVKKRRWSSFHGSEVTLLDVTLPAKVEYWITICIEGMPRTQVPTVISHVQSILTSEFSCADDTQACGYSRWLHTRVFAQPLEKL